MATDRTHLQSFAQVAGVCSFTLAAGRVGIPRSSISLTVCQLETRRGVRLRRENTEASR
jgi:DNA-binding transcriptional LysR family regulator